MPKPEDDYQAKDEKQEDALRSLRAERQLLEAALRSRTGIPLLGPDAPPPVEHVVLSTPEGPLSALKIMIEGMAFLAREETASPTLEADQPDTILRMLLNRDWPAATTMLLLPVSHGEVMLDIGANVGLTSIPRAMLGLFRVIHAFEPEPANAACLAEAVSINGLPDRIKVWRLAVGSTTGSARLRINERLGKHRLARPRKKAKPNERAVDVVTIDDWAEREGIDIGAVHFVKVDVEGFEAHVLAGAQKLLAKRRAVWQIEIAPARWPAVESSATDFLDLLERNFSVFLDLGGKAAGVRPISEVRNVVTGMVRKKTDIVVVP